VNLSAEANARERCSRCLTEIETPIEITFEEEYVPVVDANTGAPVRSALLPDTFRIGPDFVLDLHEGVRQYILMSEPAKPLCRTDCKGLCPELRRGLEQGACRCAVDGDDRWQHSRDLRQKTKELGMPPLPKKKHSVSRKRRKRAHISMTAPNLVPCPQCRSPRPPTTPVQSAEHTEAVTSWLSASNGDALRPARRPGSLSSVAVLYFGWP
jgi:hypothetical protein